MDKIRYSSFKFKVWEDQMYKIERQRQTIHLEDIKLENSTKFAQGAAKASSFNQTFAKGDFFGDPKLEEVKVNAIRQGLSQAPFLKKGESFKHQDAMDYYATGHHHLDKKRSKHFDEVEVEE
jgi:hypothetical protein